MFIDLVLAKNNEKEFIKIADRLGIDGICFIYNFKNKNNFLQNQEKINKLQEKTEIKLFIGLISDSKNISKAKKYLKTL